MLDAPVSGSIPRVKSGTLAILVGGDQHAFAAVEPLLHQLGQTISYIGPSGQGLLLELAVADKVLTRARDLGFAHRDLAALHDVLARTVVTPGAGT